LLTSLSGLATNGLAGVTHTLALVRLRLADLADVRGDLADGLLVDPAHGELVVALDREGDAGRRLDVDRVREAERELDDRTLLRDAVTGADDLQALRVALGDADDVVVDERAGEAVQRARRALVVRTGDQDLALLQLRLDRARDGERELALRALDSDGLAVDLHIDPSGDVDGQSSNTR